MPSGDPIGLVFPLAAHTHVAADSVWRPPLLVCQEEKLIFFLFFSSFLLHTWLGSFRAFLPAGSPAAARRSPPGLPSGCPGRRWHRGALLALSPLSAAATQLLLPLGPLPVTPLAPQLHCHWRRASADSPFSAGPGTWPSASGSHFLRCSSTLPPPRTAAGIVLSC